MTFFGLNVGFHHSVEKDFVWVINKKCGFTQATKEQKIGLQIFAGAAANIINSWLVCVSTIDHKSPFSRNGFLEL